MLKPEAKNAGIGLEIFVIENTNNQMKKITHKNLNITAVGNARKNYERFASSFLSALSNSNLKPKVGDVYFITELVWDEATRLPRIYKRKPINWIAEIEIIESDE